MCTHATFFPLFMQLGGPSGPPPPDPPLYKHVIDKTIRPWPFDWPSMLGTDRLVTLKAKWDLSISPSDSPLITIQSCGTPLTILSVHSDVRYDCAKSHYETIDYGDDKIPKSKLVNTLPSSWSLYLGSTLGVSPVDRLEQRCGNQHGLYTGAVLW